MTRLTGIEIGVATRESEKLRPLVTALLAAAAEQEATKWEFEKACELAMRIIRDEMSQANVCVSEFARRGIDAVERI